MKPVRWLWAIGLLVGTLGWSLAQTPTIILTNGDVNGDNTVDDADLLAVLFAMGQSCPSGCPEDLNGDGDVDDADLLITMFNQGQQGASAFAGQVQPPSGVFRVPLTVRLGDWSGADQPVKVQVKPVGSENDPNVPIYEYTLSVGGVDTQVELTNLPVGVYTVRAFPADAGRWLRTEGRIITEAPWVFAAPTGANKVTVYWDPVPGATGYRVRWGVASGAYPNASGVLPADARRFTVEGLVSDQEYSFVVEAEYNGLWGPTSEEDSAVPHTGAIPWDTEDPNQVIPAVLQALGEPEWRDIEILSPDDLYYVQENGTRTVSIASVYYNELEDWVETTEGYVLVPATSPADSSGVPCHPSGVYRQVRSKTESMAMGAKGQFWVPPDIDVVYRGIYVNEGQGCTTRDAPHIYFGIAYQIGGRQYDIILQMSP
ncbi:MAG: hypothetical protein KatS3mg019_2588 [Fimbriimonadales bacterium]|nr:MAG: hypothetical protein KatS3mg019_2588 [Fimbriimonadales bacterium]